MDSVYNDLDFAWMAGIIDGEGSIMLISNHSREHPSPTISVTNTSYEMLAELQKLSGGSITLQKKYQDHHTTCWIWKLTGNKVLDLLPKILPYLRVGKKRLRAQYLIDNYKKTTIRNGKYSPDQLSKKLEFYKTFISLS